jgi:hypothetical protein
MTADGMEAIFRKFKKKVIINGVPLALNIPILPLVA